MTDEQTTLDLRIYDAMERAEAERDRIEAKVAAFEAFGERVREVSTDAGQQASVSAKSGVGRSAGSALAAGASSTGGTTGTGRATSARGTTGTAGAETVREAFAETVLPRADADTLAEAMADTLAEAMADELSAELAAALSPAAGGFAPGLKGQLLSQVEARQQECGLLADAVGTERDRLREVADEIEDITDWLAAADETRLLQLGFEDLRQRHDRLAAFRETCDRIASERQSAVRGTQNDGLTGIRESELLDHLYGDFEDDHPALADLARLDAVLADCQRAVRDHLCARV